MQSKNIPFLLRDLTPIQRQYRNDFDHRFFVTSSGRRSRKTIIGEDKIRQITLNKPSSFAVHCAPTFGQAKSIFWDSGRGVKEFYAGLYDPKSGINNTSLTITLFNGSKIMVAGLDRPERIEGAPKNAFHITEVDDIKPKSWHEHIQPMISEFDDSIVIFDGVPNGRKFEYELALKASGGVLPEIRPYTGGFAENGKWCFYSWFSSDVLSPEAIEDARRDLDERTFRQEYEGSFESYEGIIFRPDRLDACFRDWKGFIDQKIRVWDLATSKNDYSDFTAGGLYGRSSEEMIMMDLAYGKWEYPEARSVIVNTARTDGIGTPIVIEGVGGFLAVAQDIKHILEPEGYTVLVENRSNGRDKLTLSSPIQAKVADGLFVILPTVNKKTVKDEWSKLTFDQREWVHDDILDTASMAYIRLFNYYENNIKPIVGGERIWKKPR